MSAMVQRFGSSCEMIDDDCLSAMPGPRNQRVASQDVQGKGCVINQSPSISSPKDKVLHAFRFVDKFVETGLKVAGRSPWEAVSMFSEFSGYGTAEIGVRAILAKASVATGDIVAMDTSSADVNTSCRKLLSENVGGCVFGNIMNVAGKSLAHELTSEIEETFKIKSNDVVKAIEAAGGSMQKLFTKNGRLRKALGPVPQDCKLLHAKGMKLGGFDEAVKQLTKLSKKTSKTATTTAMRAFFVFSRRTAL